MCEIEPVWASEVEPYPIAVTRSRFPSMKHLGDISRINGAEIEPVDIITFGSPCQGLSYAGLRKGLEDNRSGLFKEAVRIIKEMREATDGQYPTFALWENVPGAFSSNKGEDFRIVLEELIKISEPSAVMPAVPKKGWAYADSYVGDGWSLAYRVFDTQYWPGTPQRRRRIYLVADFRGQRARKVLFERKGLRGYLTQSPPPRERVTAYVEVGPGAADRAIAGANGIGILNEWESRSSHVPDGTGDTAIIDNIGGQAEYGKMSKVNGTLRAGALGAVAYSIETFHCTTEEEKVQTLKARDWKDPHVVAYPKEIHEFVSENNSDAPHQQDLLQTADGVARTLAAGTHGAASHLTKTIIYQENKYIVRRLTPTECARLQGFPDKWGHPDKKEELTEEEYRFWQEVRNTHAAINGKAVKEYTKAQMLTWYNKLHSDSAEYKMWGNGIALPPSLYCMQGIVDVLKREHLGTCTAKTRG